MTLWLLELEAHTLSSKPAIASFEALVVAQPLRNKAVIILCNAHDRQVSDHECNSGEGTYEQLYHDKDVQSKACVPNQFLDNLRVYNQETREKQNDIGFVYIYFREMTNTRSVERNIRCCHWTE